MNIQDNSAPTIEELNNTILMLNDRILGLEQQNAELNAKWYEEQFRLSQQRRFGASSEKTDPEQINLFNEAEDTADPANLEPTLETITYQRKKREPGQKAASLKTCRWKSSNTGFPRTNRSAPAAMATSMR